MSDVMEKYRDMGLKAKELFSQIRCSHCREPIERDKYHPDTCAHCGAELAETKVFGYCYGVPVTDMYDYYAMLTCSEFVYEKQLPDRR